MNVLDHVGRTTVCKLRDSDENNTNPDDEILVITQYCDRGTSSATIWIPKMYLKRFIRSLQDCAAASVAENPEIF